MARWCGVSWPNSLWPAVAKNSAKRPYHPITEGIAGPLQPTNSASSRAAPNNLAFPLNWQVDFAKGGTAKTLLENQSDQSQTTPNFLSKLQATQPSHPKPVRFFTPWHGNAGHQKTSGKKWRRHTANFKPCGSRLTASAKFWLRFPKTAVSPHQIAACQSV
jgi:hypothetical protein